MKAPKMMSRGRKTTRSMAATAFVSFCGDGSRQTVDPGSLLGDQCAIAAADGRATPSAPTPRLRNPSRRSGLTDDPARLGCRLREHPGAEPLSRHQHPRSALEGTDRAQDRRRVSRYRQHHAGVRRPRRRRHRRGRRRQPPHRPRLRHRRDHDRQRVTARRRSGARAGRRLHPHLLHDHAVRGVRRRRRSSSTGSPRAPAKSARRCSTRAPRPSRTPSRSPGPTPTSRRWSRSITRITAART